MPRLHFVKKARKDNPAVKAGESYYWWKFRYAGKRYSKERPRRSQLTQSAYLGTVYDLEDALVAFGDAADTEGLVLDLDNLRDECENSLDNMPQILQETSESGMLLQERIDALEDGIQLLQDLELGEIEEPEDRLDAVIDVLSDLAI